MFQKAIILMHCKLLMQKKYFLFARRFINWNLNVNTTFDFRAQRSDAHC